jgi:hypothetical protein
VFPAAVVLEEKTADAGAAYVVPGQTPLPIRDLDRLLRGGRAGRERRLRPPCSRSRPSLTVIWPGGSALPGLGESVRPGLYRAPREMVRLEIRGEVVVLPRAQAERAQELASEQAGVSSRLRDLALVLDWALNTPRVVTLRRSEARELERLARHPHLRELAEALSPARRDARAA